MMPPITPGAYLKQRRCAALLSVADAAALLPTDPATPEHERVLQLELIEADAQPMTLTTIMALRAVYHFDLEVLGRLEAIAQGQDLPAPSLCGVCGWGTTYDQLYWPALGLCHACYTALAPEDVAARVAERAHPAFRSAAA
ncbi:XRE family transcriptional regulator [uncultured Sphingomonas sp.]|uniref:XRE family transcriptional regulator n=1 Tax=uncultured Sphingomonas sp. TaxID=158754 RepID=UPI0035C9CA53